MLKKRQVKATSLTMFPKVVDVVQTTLNTTLRPVQSEGKRYLPLTNVLTDEWTMDTTISALRPVLRDCGLDQEFNELKSEFTFYAFDSDIYVDLVYTKRGELKLDLYVI